MNIQKFFLVAALTCATIAPARMAAAYNWNNVAVGGGGFVTGVIPSKTEPNMVYARTDVGGAFRWDNANARWVALLDWVAEDQVGYQGVESLAVDPKNAAIIYLLGGISYFNGGKSAIMRSTDYGRTFSVLDVSSQFKAHGNGMGRQSGERLIVDPGRSDVLYVGTRANGLFQSINSGASWFALNSLPVTTTPNGNGINIVMADPASVTGNGAAQRLFVGVSRFGTVGPNLYRSNDAGGSFTAVAGAPNLMPQRAAFDGAGNLIITYADGAGPSGESAKGEPMSTGQIWKYNIANGAWTNITPSGWTTPFSGISVAAGNPQRLVTSTINTWYNQGSLPNTGGDRILISNNGGASWTDVVERGFAKNSDGVTWIDDPHGTIHFAGAAVFDPFNSQRVWVTSGNGLFRTDNIDAATTVWTFNVKGLEETVALNAVSIAGGPMLSALGDVEGLRHYNIWDYGNPASSPWMGTTTGLAVADGGSGAAVRVGSQMYTSPNGGVNWYQTASMNGIFGQVALSANGSVLLHSPENSATTYRSLNSGGSWTSVGGLAINTARPVADPVNTNKFYAYDSSNGAFMISIDAGASFWQFNTLPQYGSNLIRVAPGHEGDVWVPLNDGGLTRTTSSGWQFTPVAGVTKCSAIGFGKAATGSNYPTVFIWGTVNGVRGLFRSTDTGASWTRINDDAHQYGGIGNGRFVVGDMNTFGVVYMSTEGRGIVFGAP